MKVLKFGGSSVGKPERIKQLAEILKSYYKKGEKFAVVFSAFGGVTDSLIEMARRASNGEKCYGEKLTEFSERHEDAVKNLLKGDLRKEVLKELKENHQTLHDLLHGIYLVREASPRTMDYVLSFGERNSSFIISKYLTQEGVRANYLDARKVIKTDKNFGAAKVNFKKTYKEIANHFDKSPEVQVVTGFIASTKGGLTTTLGRGGSDYTAALLAAGLDAKIIEIWTDVDGVLTADPRKVKRAFTIPKMSYAEAMEMAHFGAKVIYPPTLQPALKKNIPLVTKNTFNPEHPGTLISSESNGTDRPIKGISSIGNISLLTLSGSGMFGVTGTASRLFSAIAQAGINVILITQGSSEASISFSVAPAHSAKAKKVVEKEFEYEIERGVINKVKVEDDLSVVAIIGENMRYQPGISGRLFQALGNNGINVVAIAQGSSELNISVVIPKSDEIKALNAMHETFFLSDVKSLHIFMVGVGLIGGTLIRQIKEHAEYLKKEQNIEVKVVGLSNSKKMLLDWQGIDLEIWKTALDASDKKADLAQYVEEMVVDMNMSNSIFIDNTADEGITNFYEKILDSSISISTPNKIATSSAYLQYQRLKNIAEKRGVKFMYETNVGAGLPIITTLNDLNMSGDRILKIEGVLSGSLSFIFNNFNGDRKFSDIVTEAKEKGYTEPDPREDLSGFDVRRKIVILARETGIALEPEEVKINSILPKKVMDAKSIDAFFKELVKEDENMEKMRQIAEKKGKLLRMIAKLENGKATIGLQEVEKDSPFATLSGSDNMVVFTTGRYKERPLVIRGPGAGAEVTAAGVFAEIVRIGNSL